MSLRRIGAAALIALPLASVAQAAATQQAAPQATQEPATPQSATPPAGQQEQTAPAAPAEGQTFSTQPVFAEPQAVIVAAVSPDGSKPPVSLDILQSRLVGKQFFLRGGWLGDSLGFNEHGIPLGDPKTGSFTLGLVEITSVNWDSHHVEIEGNRYAIHFLGNLPYESTAHEVEHVSLSSKHHMHISIERAKLDGGAKAKHPEPAAAAPSPESTQLASTNPTPANLASQPAFVNPEQKPEHKPERVTNVAAIANTLNDALERIFVPALDNTMRSQLPEFWQLYYESQRTGKRFDPHNAGVFHASAVDQQAKILTSIAPQSNEFATNNNIVGMALYRVVIGADGTAHQIAAERPIGVGLDENAVAAIRKATFQPAIKNGQPVDELLDLSVMFRIYSNTATGSAQLVATADDTTPAPAAPRATVHAAMPGPFSAPQPAQQPAPQQPAAQETTTQPDAQPTENAPIVVDSSPQPAATQTTTPPAEPATPQTAPQAAPHL